MTKELTPEQKAARKAYVATYKASHRAELAAKQKDYYASHKAESKEYHDAYRKENSAKVAEYHRKYRLENHEKLVSYIQCYYEHNKEQYTVYSNARRARKAGSGGRLSIGLDDTLFEAQNGLCVYCKVDLLTTSYHMDHIMPLFLGGSNTDDNIQLLCPACNLHKGAKHPDTYIPRKLDVPDSATT
jgi:5-methylcytosine-specific restriction endonuclease McrA